MSEPTTEAGRALLDASTPDAASAEFGVAISLHSIIRHAVPRIEQEARREAYAKVRAAVGVAFIEAMRDMARTEALVIVEDRVLAAIEDIRKEASDGR